MDEEIERLVVSVRADTAGFARDVGDMRASLDGPLQTGAARAGQAIEGALTKAVKNGKLGFDDLGKVALSVLADIAGAALHNGIQSLFGGGGGGSGAGGLLGAITGLFTGAPGRATGGPVSPGRPYWVGERGPELFVPTASGSIAPSSGPSGREVRVAITVNAAADAAPKALAASSRQVARAVRAALMEGG